MKEKHVGVGNAGDDPNSRSGVLSSCQGLPRDMLETGRDQLRKLSAEQRGHTGDLPEWIRESMCTACGSVLTPGVNCRVRIRHRSLASPSVKNTTKGAGKKRPKKCRNQVVTTCSLCEAANAREGTERRAHHNKRKMGGSGVADGADVVAHATSGKAPKTPQGSRVPDTLRGNFIPLGNASASTPVSTLAQQSNNKRTRGAPARSTGSSNTPATAKRSAQKQGGGRAGTAMLGDTRQNGSNTLSNSLMSVGIVLGGNGSGCVTEQSSIDGAGAKLEAPSLLEQIRKDAKKKRRQEAAAKAASLG